jgi:flagella basal body P-ring formation protein FlgA
MDWRGRRPVLASALGALLAGGAAAQQPPAARPEVPPAIAARVADAIALRWAVPASRLELAWGSAARLAGAAPDVPFRLVGADSEGWFAAVFEPTGRPATAVRVRAGVAESVTVAARALTRGTALGPQDLARAVRTRWGAPRPSGTEPAAGWLVRRAVAAGTLLDAQIAAPPPVVSAGSQVRVEWTQGNLTLGFDGTALTDAALGATVLVRPAGRSAAVRATVIGPAAVRLAL